MPIAQFEQYHPPTPQPQVAPAAQQALDLSGRNSGIQEVGAFQSRNYIPLSQGWRLNDDGLEAAGGTIIGGTLKTATTGKRVEISSNEIRIYDASNNLTATISGTSIGGIASAINATFGLFAMTGFTDQGGGSGLFSLGAGIDCAVGSDAGSLLLSARKSGGGGGNINLVAETGKKVNVYERLRIIPQSAAPSSPEEGDLYVDSDDHKLYIYNGTSWVVVGTQT